MINKTILIGNLGRDPELRYTQQGTAVISFDIAVARQFKGADGKRESDWVTIIAWKQLAELCAQYLKKGSHVAIDGRIQTGSYENKEGQKVKTFEIVAENVQFLGGKNQSQDSSGSSNYDKGNTAEKSDPFNNDKVIDISDDDLPF